MLCTRKLDEIVGLELDDTGRQSFACKPGAGLKKLNMWLQAHGMEIPFQAEIGEATVGSVAVGDTKESSLDGPGYFSAHVLALTYVNDKGDLCTLSAQKDGSAFHEFKCSFGLSGIVVECQLEVRPATLCRSDISLGVYQSPEDLATGLIRMREESDALLAIVFLHQLASFFDQRYKAGPGSATPASSQPACDQFRVAKRLAIQHGFDGVDVPQPQGIVYSRHDFVNEYWRPSADERRLDFQYYEHDIAQINRVIVESFKFTKAFEERTGFVPKGWATYFVQRPREGQEAFRALFRRTRGFIFVRSVLLESDRLPMATVRSGVQQAGASYARGKRFTDSDTMAAARRRKDSRKVGSAAIYYKIL